MASAARGDAFPRDIEDRIKGMLQAVGSPRECDGREAASLGMRTGVPGHAGGGHHQAGADWDDEDDPGARGWGRESYDPPADSLDALEEECQFSSVSAAARAVVSPPLCQSRLARPQLVKQVPSAPRTLLLPAGPQRCQVLLKDGPRRRS